MCHVPESLMLSKLTGHDQHEEEGDKGVDDMGSGPEQKGRPKLDEFRQSVSGVLHFICQSTCMRTNRGEVSRLSMALYRSRCLSHP